jgi:hypothetical protein
MKSPTEFLAPNRSGFESDPFGYANLAWTRWAFVQNSEGFDVDPDKPATRQDLKSPFLWLSHAHALSEAAMRVIEGEPNLTHFPVPTKGICHSQYFAVSLMLVGYSLEICLKGMLIMQKGEASYSAEENKYTNHKLAQLAEFVPNLNKKDKAILELLSFFLIWAGRYPDPGSRNEKQPEAIFNLSQQHKITARDLFSLVGRVMSHAQQIAG